MDKTKPKLNESPDDEDVTIFPNQEKQKTAMMKFKKPRLEINEDANAIAGPSQTSFKHTSMQKLTSFIDTVSDSEQSELQTLFCEAVYSSNCALSMFESDKWKHFFGKLRPAFKIPDRKTMSTSQLDKCYNKIKCNVKEMLDIDDNITLMSNGWTNIRNEGLINYMVHTSNGDFFYDFSQPHAFRHTGQYISSEITRIIREIGENKITSLVTDNAASMQAAWAQLKETFPNLQTYGCISHILNLLLKDIEAVKTLLNHINVCKEIVKFFKLKHIPNAILTEKQGNSVQSLKLPVVTRWGSTVTCMESIQLNKQLLKECLINPDIESLATNKVKSAILSDDVFWDRNVKFIELLSPVVRLITFMENTTATLSDVRHKLYLLKEHFNNFLSQSPFLQGEEKITTISLIRRIDMACTNTHNAAYLLDPRYKGENLTLDELESTTNLIVQLSVNKSEVEIIGEILNFRTASNEFNSRIIWTAVKGIKTVQKTSSDIMPSTWWESFQKKSVLHDVALKLLSMPASSASCERNWSAWGIVHNKLRNRLTTTRSGKLVYIKYNLNMMNKSRRVKDLNISSSSEAGSEAEEYSSSEAEHLTSESEDENLPVATLLHS